MIFKKNISIDIQLYNSIYGIVEQSFSYEDKEDEKIYREFITDCMYAIVDKLDKGNEDGPIIEKFENLDFIKIYKEKNNIGGYTNGKQIYLNKDIFGDSAEDFSRILVHELCHVASFNYLNKEEESKPFAGITYNEMNSLNEALTVFIEREITKEYFDFEPFKSTEKGIQIKSNRELLFDSYLKGYNNFSDYSKFLIAMEGNNLIDLYFKKGKYENDDFLYLQDLKNLNDKYSRLNEFLDVFIDYDRTSDSFLQKDNYMKVNYEMFSILKREIDKGLNLEEYIKITNYLQKNFTLAAKDFEKNTYRDIMDESIQMADMYYFSKFIEANPLEINHFLKKKLEDNDLYQSLVYNKISGFGHAKKLSNIMESFRNNYRGNNDYFKKYDDENLNKTILTYINDIKELPVREDMLKNLNKDKIYENQFCYNYLSFMEPKADAEEENLLKTLLNENTENLEEITQKIRKESKKYRINYFLNSWKKTDYEPFYDKNFIMDIVTKTSDLKYFKDVVNVMANENEEWFNKLIKEKSKIETETGVIEVTPLEYALNNSKPEMFLILANFSDGNLEPVKLSNVSGLLLHYSNLSEKIQLERTEKAMEINLPKLNIKLQEQGYRKFLDLVYIEDKDKTKQAYFSLIEDYMKRPNPDFEYNMKKLFELGCPIYEYLGNSKTIIVDNKDCDLLTALQKIDKEKFILENSNNKNEDSLNFELDKDTFYGIGFNYLIKNPEEIKNVELLKDFYYEDFLNYCIQSNMFEDNVKKQFNKCLENALLSPDVLDKLSSKKIMECYNSARNKLKENVFDKSTFLKISRNIHKYVLDEDSQYLTQEYIKNLIRNYNSENASYLKDILEKKDISYSFSTIMSDIVRDYKNLTYYDKGVLLKNVREFIKDIGITVNNGLKLCENEGSLELKKENIVLETIRAFNNEKENLLDFELKNIIIQNAIKIFGTDSAGFYTYSSLDNNRNINYNIEVVRSNIDFNTSYFNNTGLDFKTLNEIKYKNFKKEYDSDMEGFLKEALIDFLKIEKDLENDTAYIQKNIARKADVEKTMDLDEILKNEKDNFYFSL